MRPKKNIVTFSEINLPRQKVDITPNLDDSNAQDNNRQPYNPSPGRPTKISKQFRNQINYRYGRKPLSRYTSSSGKITGPQKETSRRHHYVRNDNDRWSVRANRRKERTLPVRLGCSGNECRTGSDTRHIAVGAPRDLEGHEDECG